MLWALLWNEKSKKDLKMSSDKFWGTKFFKAQNRSIFCIADHEKDCIFYCMDYHSSLRNALIHLSQFTHDMNEKSVKNYLEILCLFNQNQKEGSPLMKKTNQAFRFSIMLQTLLQKYFLASISTFRKLHETLSPHLEVLDHTNFLHQVSIKLCQIKVKKKKKFSEKYLAIWKMLVY